MQKDIREILTKVQNGEQSIGEAESQILFLFTNNTNSIATKYAEFCVRCDREKLPLLCLDDYMTV